MQTAAEYLIATLLLVGGAFTLIGAIGLARMPDFFTRLHAPTKATTLGVGAIMVASIAYGYHQGGELNISELLITVFLFLTAPVSANILAKSAMHLDVKKLEETRGKPWNQ